MLTLIYHSLYALWLNQLLKKYSMCSQLTRSKPYRKHVEQRQVELRPFTLDADAAWKRLGRDKLDRSVRIISYCSVVM